MKATIGGAPLRYDVRGQGPALLFLHAFPLDLTLWDAQVQRLESTHLVIRFDARGFGGSPPGDSLLTMERIADDAAALLDHLDVASAVLCGVSMGGYAAFAFVRRHARRLAGLVLSDTRVGADSLEARKLRADQAERVRREGSAALVDVFLPKLVGETTHRERPQVVARLRAIIAGTAPRGIADALAGLAARADSEPTLREVTVPTLVVCGAEDLLTPVAEAERIAHGIAGSRLEVVARTGHLPCVEDSEAFNRPLVSFLRSL